MIPVNPRETEILGEVSYPSLSDVPVPVDIVNVFRAPDALPAIAREAVAIHAGALWCQFGVINEEGARIAEDGGLTVDHGPLPEGRARALRRAACTGSASTRSASPRCEDHSSNRADRLGAPRTASGTETQTTKAALTDGLRVSVGRFAGLLQVLRPGRPRFSERRSRTGTPDVKRTTISWHTQLSRRGLLRR